MLGLNLREEFHGRRLCVTAIEKQYRTQLTTAGTTPAFTPEQRAELLTTQIEPALARELAHRGIATSEKGYNAELIAWVEIAKTKDRVNRA